MAGISPGGLSLPTGRACPAKRSASYYGALDHIDWVAYYKNHGYQINAGMCGPCGGSQRIQFAPVFVSPTMQWAVPNSCLSGGPSGPAFPPMAAFPGAGPAYAGYPHP